MRLHLREFFELCAKTLACPEPIVEIGAFQVVGEEALADLRPLSRESFYRLRYATLRRTPAG